MTRTIPYTDLIAVRSSTDSGSALALSLDRLKIQYSTDELLIAPKNKDAFLKDLAARTPQLSRVGQELVTAIISADQPLESRDLE